MGDNDSMRTASQKFRHEDTQIVHVEGLVQHVYGTRPPRLFMHLVVAERCDEKHGRGIRAMAYPC